MFLHSSGSMEIPLRTAYGQNGRCDMQPKPSSLRAQRSAKQNRNREERLLETLDIRKREAKRERTREVREQALPSEYNRQTYL
ncbi:hypothetical protein TNCV_2128851 [Trichonephila clavipes]|nr:hypothetical protein TNCV_2128851 [Trichonephila clavipes]